MKKINLYIILCLIPFLNFAQQVGPLSQYSLNPYYYNSGAIGLTNGLQGTMGFRQQWAGLEGSPKSFFLNANAVVHTSRITSLFGRKYLKGQVMDQSKFTKRGKNGISMKHAVGGQFSRDQYGAFTQTAFQVSYALHLPFNKVGVSIGLSPGFGNIRLNRDQVSLLNDQDATYDAYLSEGASTSFFNLNSGLYIYSEKGYLGYSTDQLLKGKYQFNKNSIASVLSIHHFIMGGYEFNPTETIKIQPNAFVGIVSGLPLNWMINTFVTYKESCFGGLGYRKGDAVIFMLGYLYEEKFRLSYSYDLNISGLNGYNKGSHELMLSVTGLLTEK